MHKRTFLTLVLLTGLLLSGSLLGRGPAPAFAASGDLDTTFGDGGKLSSNISSLANMQGGLGDLALRTDGSIAAVGFTFPSGNSAGLKVAVASFNAQGKLDPAFGDAYQPGRRTFSPSHLAAMGKAVIALPSGKLLIGGGGGFTLARLNPDGSLDTSYDGDGLVSGSGTVVKMVRATSGKIVALIESYSDFVLRRFNDDGTLDSSFGVSGTVTTDFDGAADHAEALALASADKIVVVGSSSNH